MNLYRGAFILLSLWALNCEAAGDKFNLAGKNVQWNRFIQDGQEILEIRISPFAGEFRPMGDHVRVDPLLPVFDSSGRRVLTSTIQGYVQDYLGYSGQRPQQKTAPAPNYAQIKNGELRYQLRPDRIESFDLLIDYIPEPIRYLLGQPISAYISDHFKEFHTSYKNQPKRMSNFDALFVDNATDPKVKIRRFLLITEKPSNMDIEVLVNQPIAEYRFRKMFYRYDDPLKPNPQNSALFVVHPMREYDRNPESIASYIDDRLQQSDGQQNKFVLLTTDGIGDKSVFINPGRSTQAIFSAQGEHALCENCREITLLGGNWSQCLATAEFSFIQNYFSVHNHGKLRINIEARGVYETYENRTYSLPELIQKLGLDAVIDRHLQGLKESPGKGPRSRKLIDDYSIQLFVDGALARNQPGTNENRSIEIHLTTTGIAPTPSQQAAQ